MAKLEDKVLDSGKIKQLVDYLAKEADGNHTEFRVVIYENGTGYAHVMNRDSTSLNFDLPIFFKRKE